MSTKTRIIGGIKMEKELICEECGERMNQYPKNYGCGFVCPSCAYMLTTGITQADLDWFAEVVEGKE